MSVIGCLEYGKGYAGEILSTCSLWKFILLKNKSLLVARGLGIYCPGAFRSFMVNWHVCLLRICNWSSMHRRNVL